MHKLVLLMLKNLGRNKIRTTLTGLAVVVLVAVHAVVTSVTSNVEEKISAQGAQTKLIVTERWVAPSRLPVRYVPEVTELPGVEDWTSWNFYTGFFDPSRRRDRMGGGLALQRLDNIGTMHEGLEDLDPKVLKALQETRSGVLMGPAAMEMMNWRVGQRFQFISLSHPGKDLEFTIVGVLPSGQWSRNFFFRYDYFQEATGDNTDVNMIWLRVKDAEAGQKVAAMVHERFATRQPSLKVETESAGVARFAARSQSVLAIIKMVVVILLIDMVIILSNSISISVRERRVEMAVLKVLGFIPMHIVIMIVGEAMLVGGLSGLVGTGIVWLCSVLVNSNILPSNPATSFFLMFPITLDTLFWGALLGMGVGLSGSLIPAWTARKVKVSDVFARIA